jgi:hypothetical protein
MWSEPMGRAYDLDMNLITDVLSVFLQNNHVSSLLSKERLVFGPAH